MTKYTILIIWFLANVSCFAQKDEISLLNFHKDETIEGAFYALPIDTPEKVKKILRGIDYMKTGNTRDNFPLCGIEAQFYVEQNGEMLILTMIRSHKSISGKIEKLFHLSKSKKIGNRIYSVAEPPNYDYLRIFEDEKLWTSLYEALDRVRSE